MHIPAAPYVGAHGEGVATHIYVHEQLALRLGAAGSTEEVQTWHGMGRYSTVPSMVSPACVLG